MERLKELREENNISQKEIGKIINVSQSAYSLYEIDKRSLPIDVLKKLSTYYKTSTDYILDLTNVKLPYPKKDTKKQ